MSKYHGVRVCGIEYVTFYVHNHIVPLPVCSGPPLVHGGPLAATEFVRLAYYANTYVTTIT